MITGVPKKLLNNENRIALTPAGAAELVKPRTSTIALTNVRFLMPFKLLKKDGNKLVSMMNLCAKD